MNEKPWPFIILAVLHLLEPVIKLIIIIWFLEISSVVNLVAFAKESSYLFFLFMFSFPIAGIAIFAVKFWSLPLLGLVYTLSIISQILEPTHLLVTYPEWLFIGTAALNVIVMGYFLLPKVRALFLKPELRWWEYDPRYKVNWKCEVMQLPKTCEGLIINISKGGALLVLPEKDKLELGRDFKFSFQFEKYSFHLTGGKVFHKQIENYVHYGVEYRNLRMDADISIRKCMLLLEKRKYPRRPERVNVVESFCSWFTKLIKTGQGLIPEVHNRPDISIDQS